MSCWAPYSRIGDDGDLHSSSSSDPDDEQSMSGVQSSTDMLNSIDTRNDMQTEHYSQHVILVPIWLCQVDIYVVIQARKRIKSKQGCSPEVEEAQYTTSRTACSWRRRDCTIYWQPITVVHALVSQRYSNIACGTCHALFESFSRAPQGGRLQPACSQAQCASSSDTPHETLSCS